MPSTQTWYPCPICKQKTKLFGGSGGSWLASQQGFARTRQCVGPGKHKFRTVEKTLASESMKNVPVDRGRGPEQFSSGDLAADLEYVLSGVLTTAELADVVAIVEVRLLSTYEDSKRESRKAPLSGREIQGAVATTLLELSEDAFYTGGQQRTFRRAHLLYTFARGVDGERLSGARAVLEWLRKTYGAFLPSDANFSIPPHYSHPRVDKWHPLRADAAPMPDEVVFLVRTHVAGRSGPPSAAEVGGTRLGDVDPTEPTGETDPSIHLRHVRQPYDQKRVTNSVMRAVAGMNDRTRIGRYVVQWVLWSLAGQKTVRSADLASQVTQCLRRVDEVAYLSWVIRVKDLDVSHVWKEAEALLTWPSPRLQFDPDAAADPRRQMHVDIAPADPVLLNDLAALSTEAGYRQDPFPA